MPGNSDEKVLMATPDHLTTTEYIKTQWSKIGVQFVKTFKEIFTLMQGSIEKIKLDERISWPNLTVDGFLGQKKCWNFAGADTLSEFFGIEMY